MAPPHISCAAPSCSPCRPTSSAALSTTGMPSPIRRRWFLAVTRGTTLVLGVHFFVLTFRSNDCNFHVCTQLVMLPRQPDASAILEEFAVSAPAAFSIPYARVWGCVIRRAVLFEVSGHVAHVQLCQCSPHYSQSKAHRRRPPTRTWQDGGCDGGNSGAARSVCSHCRDQPAVHIRARAGAFGCMQTVRVCRSVSSHRTVRSGVASQRLSSRQQSNT